MQLIKLRFFAKNVSNAGDSSQPLVLKSIGSDRYFGLERARKVPSKEEIMSFILQ